MDFRIVAIFGQLNEYRLVCTDEGHHHPIYQIQKATSDGLRVEWEEFETFWTISPRDKHETWLSALLVAVDQNNIIRQKK